jgi:dTDP-4-dehydrorhamnose 3,5-epimerase
MVWIVLFCRNKKQFLFRRILSWFLVYSDMEEFTKISDFYQPNDEGGILWNDRNGVDATGNNMKLIISEKDQKWEVLRKWENKFREKKVN